MATILLVAGGWHGGWWFQPVTDQLRRLGHDVYPVTLTGIGERRHLDTSVVNLDTHIDDVATTIECEQLDQVVLCAHSYGGMVITAVADRIPERVAALVGIDAQIPRDGESLWYLTTEEARQAFIAACADGAHVNPPPGLDERTTPHPLASFVQPINLTGAWEQVTKRYFVWLSEWEGSPTKFIYDGLREDSSWDVAHGRSVTTSSARAPTGSSSFCRSLPPTSRLLPMTRPDSRTPIGHLRT